MRATTHPQHRYRRVVVWCGAVAVLVSAVPAWNRLTSSLALGRAQQALRDGDVELAWRGLQDLQKAQPRRADCCYALAVANRRLGRLDAAFQLLQQAEDLGWPIEEVTRQRYLARFQAGDIAGTKQYLNRLITSGVNDETAEEVYEALAKGYLAEYRPADAVAVLDKWIQWRPDLVQPRVWRAQVYRDVAQWPAAIPDYRQIVELAPESVDHHLDLAEALFLNGDIDEAHQRYQETRRRFPDELRATVGLAQCERRLGNADAARGLLSEALSRNVTGVLRANALFELGQLSLDAANADEAAKHLEEAATITPNDSRLQYALGSAYSRLGKEAEALVHFQQADKITQNHRRIWKLRQDVVTQPANVAARFEIATVLRELGYTADAYHWFLTVVHLDPQHTAARQAAAEIRSTLDQQALADADSPTSGAGDVGARRFPGPANDRQ